MFGNGAATGPWSILTSWLSTPLAQPSLTPFGSCGPAVGVTTLEACHVQVVARSSAATSSACALVEFSSRRTRSHPRACNEPGGQENWGRKMKYQEPSMEETFSCPNVSARTCPVRSTGCMPGGLARVFHLVDRASRRGDPQRYPSILCCR
jgi:hypothetical protein